MKKVIKAVSVLIATTLLCMSVTGCQNPAANEELIARNNAIRTQQYSATTDETGGVYTPYTHWYQYVDFQSKSMIPVCGKPDCSHEENSGCIANRLVFESDQNFYYYNDLLYYTKDGKLFQSDSTLGNEKELADFNALMKTQIEQAMTKDEYLRTGMISLLMAGMHNERLYLLATARMDRISSQDSTASYSGYDNLYDLFVYDLTSGKTERLNIPLIEKLPPYAQNVQFALCDTLLLLCANMTPQEYVETSDMTAPEMNQNTFSIYTYDLETQEEKESWRFEQVDSVNVRVNEDGTFLLEQIRVKDDWSVYQQDYIEYTADCKETSAFSLENSFSLTKKEQCYYYSKQNVAAVFAYTPQTDRTEEYTLPANVNGFWMICGDQMLTYGSPEGTQLGVIDLQVLSSGKVEVQAISDWMRTAE